jgi:UDP-2-acetamido-2-deoxy-ribo-hexuluronate aminotransferase
MPDYSKINAIAAKYGIPVIQDAAQSFGATQNGRKSCGISTVGATSFYPAKPLGCYGDGGALFTDDDVLAQKLLSLRTYGGVQRHHYDTLGINGRFDTIQAAIMLVKLKYFDAELQARNEIAARYDFLLKGHCAVPPIASGNTHSYAQYTIRIQERDHFVQEMTKAGIPTSLYYPKCVHEQPCFAYLGYAPGSFPLAECAAREVVSLPMHPYLTVEQQEKICHKIAALTPASVV